LLLKEWREVSKSLGNGEHVNFDGFIKSREEYDDISTKLLRCLEQNCTSKRRFTRYNTLKDHVVQQHFVKQIAMRDGETTNSPSYLDRVAAAQEEGKARVSGEDYVALMEDYRSLEKVVRRTEKLRFIHHVIHPLI